MTPPESSGTRRFVWPSDYYSSATPTPLLPPWAAFGCGAAATVFLVLIFTGGFLLSRGGFNEFFDFVIGMSVAEMKGQYAADIPPAQKESVDAEIRQMRENLREGRVSVPALQPFLETMRTVSSDKRITTPEVEKLRSAARAINQRASAKNPPAPLSEPLD